MKPEPAFSGLRYMVDLFAVRSLHWAEPAATDFVALRCELLSRPILARLLRQGRRTLSAGTNLFVLSVAVRITGSPQSQVCSCMLSACVAVPASVIIARLRHLLVFSLRQVRQSPGPVAAHTSCEGPQLLRLVVVMCGKRQMTAVRGSSGASRTSSFRQVPAAARYLTRWISLVKW